MQAFFFLERYDDVRKTWRRSKTRVGCRIMRVLCLHIPYTWGGGGCTRICRVPVVVRPLTSHPDHAGTEYAEFSPNQAGGGGGYSFSCKGQEGVSSMGPHMPALPREEGEGEGVGSSVSEGI